MEGEALIKLDGVEYGFILGLAVIEDACIENDIDFMAAIAGDMKQAKRYESISNLMSMAYFANKLYARLNKGAATLTQEEFIQKINAELQFVVDFRQFMTKCMTKNIPTESQPVAKKKQSRKATGTVT